MVRLGYNDYCFVVIFNDKSKFLGSSFKWFSNNKQVQWKLFYGNSNLQMVHIIYLLWFWFYGILWLSEWTNLQVIGLLLVLWYSI